MDKYTFEKIFLGILTSIFFIIKLPIYLLKTLFRLNFRKEKGYLSNLYKIDNNISMKLLPNNYYKIYKNNKNILYEFYVEGNKLFSRNCYSNIKTAWKEENDYRIKFYVFFISLKYPLKDIKTCFKNLGL